MCDREGRRRSKPKMKEAHKMCATNGVYIACMHAQSPALACVCVRAHTHMHTHPRTCTHTRTHTRKTESNMLLPPLLLCPALKYEFTRS